MLEIKNIKKEYRTAGLTQMALDGVSMNLRDNEFVAVLGPSGSGKTTFLNIIGGLDQADSGELVINGVSTAKYRDRDWDTYRNHTIGFVFQSYNLIPHQTVLKNVELALIIGGVPAAERKERAERALAEVGLAEHIHKLPMQLSGGQMQRVAIARALVNDPDIVLADEPTGALDSTTGLQVMELLKKVAEDRLVVMVTHNPELADQYATRIINLRDGKVISDSDPFDPHAALAPDQDPDSTSDEVSDAAHDDAASTPDAVAESEDDNASTDEKPEDGIVATASTGIAAASTQNVDAAEKDAAEAAKDDTAAKEAAAARRKEKQKRASMSFLTALSLSFNNLMTKKGRTILVAFAGSIGIIGIALILSLSNGVNKYIDTVEEETLAEYPVQIQDTGFDLTSIISTAEGISGSNESEKDGDKSKDKDKSKGDDISTNGKGVEGSAVDEMDEYGKKIGEMKTVTEILSKSNSNDLAAFMDFLDSKESGIAEYTSAIEYKYSITPLIYREDNNGKFRQVNPDKSFAAVGITGSGGTSNSMMSMMMSTDSFNALPADEKMYKDQYEVVAGSWPEKESDLVLILSADGKVSDLVLYMLGERDPKELEKAIKKFAKGEEVEIDTSDREFDSSYFMGQEFRLIKNSECFKYDEDKDIYIDKRDDKSYMNKVAKKSEKLKITGIVKPREDSSIRVLTIGIGYHPDLVKYIIEQNQDAAIVKAQKDDKSKNVLTGKDFGDDDNSDFDFEDMMDVDKDALQDAFKFDAGKLKVNPNKLPQPDKDDFDFSSVFASMQNEDTGKIMSQMMTDLMTGFADSMSEQQGGSMDPEEMAAGLAAYLKSDEGAAILSQITPESTEEEKIQVITVLYMSYTAYAMEHGMSNEVDMGKAMEEYMKSDEAQKIISAASANMTPDMSGISKKLQQKMTEGMKKYMTTYTKAMMKQLAQGLKHAMSVNPDAFAAAIKMDMDEDDLTQMITQLMTTGNATYEDNMKDFGYADLDKPSMILIYPKDFDSKEKVTGIIDGYNDRMKKAGEDDKVITYSDIVGTLMSSVTDIINQLSMILIAFVAISLVVSSIMIGVITYISVLERKKEIGILRAMGASKGNVANVFNAETFIIGALAGLLGIGISLALLIPGNLIIQTLAEGTRMRAQMPPRAAVILVLLSIVLTLIGGWIPSRKAANSDPVTALRTE